jgi:hypothetical protein
MFPLNPVVRHFVDAERVSMIGIGLGERFTAAACGINFEDGNEARNLAIKRSALFQPNATFTDKEWLFL